MPKFTKKPVTVEASQWWENGDHPLDGDDPSLEGKVVRYFRHPEVVGATPCRHCTVPMHNHGWIDTLEGGHIVCPGDWVITGVANEFYPCKPDIFAQTYAPERVIEHQHHGRDGHVTTEECYEEFWKPIVENPDGTLNVEQVKQELRDFHYIMDQAKKVNYHVSGGRMSYPHYDGEAVISLYDEEIERAYEQAREDFQRDAEEAEKQGAMESALFDDGSCDCGGPC